MDLPRSRSGYTCVLVGVDRYSKFGHVVPLRSKTSRMVALAMEAYILATVPRTPETILSDSGPEFRGGPFRDLSQSYGIVHERSVPYAPHTNGQVERLNQTLKNRLAIICHGDILWLAQFKWSEHRSLNDVLGTSLTQSWFPDCSQQPTNTLI